MKNTFGRYMKISFATLAFLIAATAQVSIYAQDSAASEPGRVRVDPTTNDQAPERLVGAWETLVTPRNCDTGEALGPAFPGVITFNLGGTIAEFGANPATPYRTPGHGIWSGGVHGNYLMKFSFIPLTPTGVPVGRIRVTQTMFLEKATDISTSSGSFILTNFSGAVLGTGCTTAVGVRINQ